MSDAQDAPKLLLIDKPKGITSFDVIRRLRRELNIKKMGHAGTLDPLASGLMLIGIGEGTKKLNEYLKLPKSYEADILVGERRATGDMEGEVLEETTVESLDEHKVRNVLAGMLGPLELPVPRYSAIKQDGVRLYAKARKGEEIEVPVRTMEVSGIGFRGMEVGGGRAIVKVRFDVASGVYIRSLAEEFGNRLGYPATIKELRRTKIGDFDVADARPI
jgi:tRNA pseudouridine55 synthase